MEKMGEDIPWIQMSPTVKAKHRWAYGGVV